MEHIVEKSQAYQSTLTSANMTRGLRLPLSDKDVKNLIYGFYKREVEVRKRAFRFTAELRNNISRIGDFLTTEDNYYGLFMPGTVGNGKTTMMRAIKDLFVYLIDKEKITYCEGDKYPTFITARELAEISRDKNSFRIVKNTKYLFIDDLGAEPVEISNYGNFVYPYIDVLEYRYDRLLPTFISSNFNASDLCNKYESERVKDRMKEMFQIISFKEESFR
nr:MAG TPA: replicative helicase [Caudoviricetes sp.]